MGCCSNRQKPPQNIAQETILVDSVKTAYEMTKVILTEIHLTKFYEKVIKNPSEFFLAFSTLTEEFFSPPIAIEGLHYTYEVPIVMVFKTPSPLATLTLLARKNSYSTTIGSISIDMSVFKSLQHYKGSTPVMYRCLKTAKIHLEITRLESESDYMTLSDQRKTVTGSYFPAKDYPSSYTSQFSPTPKFNTFTINEYNSALSQNIEKLSIVKQKYVDFNYLISNIEDNSAEIIYYICDRLAYYACQSTYSEQIEIDKILLILRKFCNDSFVCTKALWLLYYLIDSSEQVIKKWHKSNINSLLLVWEQFHSKECTMLVLEVILKFVGNETARLNKIVAEVRVLSSKSMNHYKDPEILCAGLIIMQKIMGMSGKPEYWQILISQGILDSCYKGLSEHIINNDLVASSLKIILAYSLAGNFTKSVASTLDVNLAYQIYSIYSTERPKLKALTQILTEILQFTEPNKSLLITNILIKSIKKNLNWGELLIIAFKGFKKYLKAKSDISILCSSKCMEAFTEVMLYLSTELNKYDDIIEVIFILGSRSEEFKTIIWKNEEILELLLDLKNLSKHSSTGSSLESSFSPNFVLILSQMLDLSY